MPLEFRPTQTESHIKRESQWLTLGGEIAEQMNHIGYGGSISISPNVQDVRPWQWRGLQAQVRYTYSLNPAESLDNLSSSKLKSLRKAESLGYSSSVTDDLDAVIYCLRQTESRQGFENGLTGGDLTFLSAHMSPEALRIYITKDALGEPVSARVALVSQTGAAIGLVAGTVGSHLKKGAAQLLIASTLEDLKSINVKTFDFGGANIESVALAKMQWGGRLVPFYGLSEIGFRSITLQSTRWIKKRLNSHIR